MRMIKLISASVALLAAMSGWAGDSAPLTLDLRTAPLVDSLAINWNAAWIGGDASATVVIADNGTEVKRTTGAGEFEHTPSGIGRHELTYTTYIDGVAQDEVYTTTVFKDWKYELRDGSAVIIGTTHTKGDVVIPSEIDGYQVTGIDGAFLGCSGLTSVTIPDGVTSIGDFAFDFCWSLAYVYISDDFAGSTDVFPSSATMVRYKHRQMVVLDACGGVVEPESVEVMFGSAYGDLPVPRRDGFCFVGWLLDGVPISGDTKVSELGDHVLVARWWEELPNGLLCEEEDGSVVVYGVSTAATDLVIPSDVRGRPVSAIASNAFFGCSSLMSVTIPDSVAHIGNYAFVGCDNLTEVTIPWSVWDIGEGAFANCTSLRRVEVAKVLKSQIESRGVFAGCPDDMEIVYISPEIRNVTAKQRYPWCEKVDVTFEVYGGLTAGLPEGTEPVFSLSATDRTTGSNYVSSASALSGDMGAAEGLHHVVWDLNADGVEFKSDDVVLSAAYNSQDKVLICSGDSASVALDLRTEPLVDFMAVMWDSSWVGDDANATIVISDNGMEVKRTTGAGEFEYTPPSIGRHELTYATYIDGVAQDEVYTATVFKDWKYEAIGGGAVIVESVHEKGDVEFPSEIDGYPVIGTWDFMKISLGDPFCFVDPNEASGYAELCNGSDWIDCWADGEDWAVVPIDGADAGDELVPVIVYGSADESMVSDVHIEDEATFKARLNAAENVECDVESTSRTTPEEIESFVASRRWLMVKINRIDGEFEPKTFFVGLKGGVEYRKFVIVREDSDGAEEDGFDDAAEAVALPLPVGSAIVSGNGVGARTVSVMPNADMKVLGWSDDDMDTSMERNLMPDGNPYFVVMVARSVGDVLGGAWTSGVEGESAAVIQADDTAEDGVSVRFSAGDDASVWVETVVSNACRVSFDWKCSCEGLFKGKPYDYLAFFVDGERKGFICGETGWTNSTFHVEGAGEHRLWWTFIRDDEGSAGEDSAWLANVSFVPSVSVSFNGGGATEGVVPEPMSAYADEGVVLPEPGSLAWPRHRFLGWSDGDTTYVAGDFYPCGGVLELTAVWEAKTLSAPVITAPAAYEADSATVTITSEEGTSIYYTIDGSTPSADGSGSRLYQGAFEVEGSATIRAVAVRDDYFDSEVAEFAVTRLTWTFGEYLNWPGQEFETGGDAEWTRAKGVSDDGYALRSGVITHGQTSRLETVVSGAGTIQFSCRVEGEIVKKTVYDGLAFCIDGVQQGDLMGNTAWAVKAFEVSGDGSHTISWLYVKDEEGDGSGDDCAWIDNISWTPSGPIPAVAGDADVATVNAMVDDVGFTDAAAVKAAIGGSAEEYNAFKTWADGVKGATGDALAGEAAVVANGHAAAAYLLGAERLFENEPTVEIGELAIAEGESAGTTAMTVAVTVKDGETAVTVNAAKVAAMFEATSDLGDWTGAAKLTPTVTTYSTDANGKMTFVVTPGDGTASKAFLRIKR